MSRQHVFAAAILAFTCAVSQAQVGPPYYLWRISLPTGATSIAGISALGEAGNAYGNVYRGAQEVPTVWQFATHNATSLPNCGSGILANGKSYYLVTAKNSSTALGVGVDSSGNSCNIYWDASHTPLAFVDTGALIADASSTGVVVGTNGGAIMRQLPAGAETVLPYTFLDDRCQSYPDYCSTAANVVSPNGRYVGGQGFDDFASFGWPGILWTDGQQGATLGYMYGINAINDSGLAVGVLYSGSNHPFFCPGYFGPRHAFGPGDLGGLTPADPCFESMAASVNATGVVVGSATVDSTFNNEHFHAVKWTNGQITDLQTILGPLLPSNTEVDSALFITDNGRILLDAVNTQTQAHSYIVAVPPVRTNMSIKSSVNASSYGQPVHLVATITPAFGPPAQGLVSWYDNGALLGQATVTSIGTTGWQTAAFAVGTHKITAKYPGYIPNGPSTSPVFTQTVVRSTTKTGVLSSTSSPVHGHAFTLIATVVPAFGTIAGTVTFKSGTTTLGTATVDGSTKRAYLSTTLKTAGKYSFTASYGATTNFAGSTSSALMLTVR